jgi:RNA-binding protein PNO1
MTPLKDKWLEIQKPIVEHMLLQVRMNVKLRSVELRTSELTQETQALQKAADFVKAFLLGFDVSDGESPVRPAFPPAHLSRSHRAAATGRSLFRDF